MWLYSQTTTGPFNAGTIASSIIYAGSIAATQITGGTIGVAIVLTAPTIVTRHPGTRRNGVISHVDI
jgi:hypothetical protein